MAKADKNPRRAQVIDLAQRRNEAVVKREAKACPTAGVAEFAILNLLLFGMRIADKKLSSATRAEVQKILESYGYGKVEDPKELERLLAQEVEKRERVIISINLAFFKHCLAGCEDPVQRLKLEEKILKLEEGLRSNRKNFEGTTRREKSD